MTQGLFVGVGLIGVSAYHLVPAVLTGAIPRRWPFKPLAREAKLAQYQFTFGVFAVAGAVGIVITIVALLRMASL